MSAVRATDCALESHVPCCRCCVTTKRVRTFAGSLLGHSGGVFPAWCFLLLKVYFEPIHNDGFAVRKVDSQSNIPHSKYTCDRLFRFVDIFSGLIACVHSIVSPVSMTSWPCLLWFANCDELTWRFVLLNDGFDCSGQDNYDKCSQRKRTM